MTSITLPTYSGITPVAPRIDLRWLVTILLFIAIFAGCQGGRYYMANRLQELGIASSLALYLIGSWRGFFLLPFREWRTWVLGPALLVGGIMGISSIVFTLNYSGKVLYSFFSAREFMLAFLGPGVYLLCRTGVSLALVRQVFWCALIALMINYLFFYFTMDLRAAFFSSDHTISNLVTYDEWRGFRLKPPLFAMMVSILAGLALMVEAQRLRTKLLALSVIALGAYIWSIVLFRSTLATMLLSMLLYPLLLSSRRQLVMIVVAAPLGMLAAPVVIALALDNFLAADGGSIRAKAFMLALEHIPRHPLLGAGEDSAYGQSYQDIVAPYFYPSDLGLVGTCYKWGVVGVSLYLGMHIKIWLSLWHSNIGHRARVGRLDPLLWGLLIFMTAQTFNLMLNPGLAYAQGITLGSLALALARLEQASDCGRN